MLAFEIHIEDKVKYNITRKIHEIYSRGESIVAIKRRLAGCIRLFLSMIKAGISRGYHEMYVAYSLYCIRNLDKIIFCE